MKKHTLSLLTASFLLLLSSVKLNAQSINFTTNTTSGCAPLAVVFHNLTTAPNAYRYEWNFNDGSPMLVDTMPNNIVHTFNTNGNYSVYVNVYNFAGNYIGFSYGNGSIQVNGAPGINSNDTTCINDMVNFCPGGNVNSCSWNFGDGATSTNNCAQHAYTATGNYTVTLTANTSCGPYTSTKTIIVSNTSYPNPSAYNSASTACPNYQINFGANGSYATYNWNFGDGTTSTQSNPQHAYSVIGTYITTLTVTNGCGNTGTTTVTTTIGGSVGFSGGNVGASPSTACPSQQIYCYASGLGGYVKYVWDFGDGSPKDSTVTAAPVYHTYSSIGTYTLSCKITNQCGLDSTFTNTVTIAGYVAFPNQPWFSMQGNPSVVCPNSNVNLQAPNGYNHYEWTFGDGSPVAITTDNYNNHMYGATLGTYNASVKIVNPCGNDTTLYTSIQITNTAHFPNQNWFSMQANGTPACPNSSINFNAPGGYANYVWNFGDGSAAEVTGTNNGTNHTYGATIGSFQASVTITNNCGFDTTLYATVQIMGGIHFPNQNWFNLQTDGATACPNSNVGFNAPGGYLDYLWNFGDGSATATTINGWNNHMYGATLGTYTASVKITNGCGNDTTLYTTIQIVNNAGFNTQSNLQLSVNSSPTCPNSSVNFNAPSNYANYVWNFGDGSPLLTTTNNGYNHSYGSAIGSYTASVKITNGCGQDTTLFNTIQVVNNVGFPNQNWFKIDGGPSPACPSDQVSMNAPSGYVNYLWKFGDGDSASSSQNHANHLYVTTGTYTVSVKITNACGNDTTLYSTQVINNSGSFSNYISINVNANTSSCPNDLIEFHVNQNGFQSYAWNFGDGTSTTVTGENIQHAYTSVGTYAVACVLTNGCGNTYTLNTTVQVSAGSPVNSTISVSGTQNPSCPNDNVFFVLNDGLPTYTYVWDYGDGSAIDTTQGSGSHHIYTAIGTYTVSVTVINGCGLTKVITTSEIVTNTTIPSLVGKDGSRIWGYPGGEHNNGVASSAGCAGDAIIFYFMGSAANNVWDFGDGNTGTATEHMLIYGGDGNAVPITIIKHSFATNGNYMIHLTLTNACGISVTDSVAINIGGNLIVNGEMTTSPPPFTTCAAINFLAFGGAHYDWTFGDGSTLSTSSPTVSHTFSTQGVYVITVLVTNGCGNTATYSKSINIDGVGGPAISLTSSTPPTCNNGTNASATIAVTSGQAPYTYLWNDANAQTSATASNLAPGLYYATVTDNIGCASVLAVSISNPTAMALTSSTTKSTCGGMDGSATITGVSAGTAPYSYMWSNGNTTATASGLAYGSYNVSVTDLNGCSVSSSVSVSELNTATISLNTVTNVNCNGGATGAVNITIAGGTPPYTYLWSNGATTQNISNVAAGNYSLLVTDNGSCNATFNATVGQSTPITVTVTAAASPTCGNFDGQAMATATGGSGTYTYLWTDAGNQTTQTAVGLFAGTHSVNITDGNGCATTGIISLSNSNAPIVTSVVNNVTCNGANNGSVDLTVTGGTSGGATGYGYTWSTGSNNQDVSALAPGTYFVQIQDAAHCSSFNLFTITQPNVLTVTASNTGATCSTNNGTAIAMPVGGNTTYSYAWTGGQSTQTATGLGIGSYTVTVTDNKGCIATANTTIATSVATPNICMVTVDDASINNLVYWDKTQFQQIDSVFIYREVSSGTYKRIGAVSDTALSQFIDTARNVGPANGDPNAGSYRYKIQVKDACGNMSAMSPYHNTIFIINAGMGQFTWSIPYTIEGAANPVANYILLCDTINTNTWTPVSTVAGTQSSATDPGFANHPTNANWRVKSNWGIGCSPTRAAINTTRSNIRHQGIITLGITTTELASSVAIYPNPATDMVTIELTGSTTSATIRIVDVVGQTVFEQDVTTSGNGKTLKQINTSTFAKGIYTVSIVKNGSAMFKKLVIN